MPYASAWPTGRTAALSPGHSGDVTTEKECQFSRPQSLSVPADATAKSTGFTESLPETAQNSWPGDRILPDVSLLYCSEYSPVSPADVPGTVGGKGGVCGLRPLSPVWKSSGIYREAAAQDLPGSDVASGWRGNRRPRPARHALQVYTALSSQGAVWTPGTTHTAVSHRHRGRPARCFQRLSPDVCGLTFKARGSSASLAAV